MLLVADAQHGTDYALKSGAQMNGMRKMIAAIAGKTDDDGSAGLTAPAPPALRPLAPNPRRAEQWARNTSRVAVVQLPAPPPDAAPGATATDVVRWVQHAGTDQVDLVLFPEYHLGNTHLSKSANGVYRSPPVAAVAAAARAAGIYVAVGAWVLWAEDTFCCPPPPKQYTNTILLFGRSGVIEGVYNKTHPAVGGPPFFWPPKDVHGGEWAMLWGDDYPVFDLDFARIGPRAPPDPGCALGWFEACCWAQASRRATMGTFPRRCARCHCRGLRWCSGPIPGAGLSGPNGPGRNP